MNIQIGEKAAVRGVIIWSVLLFLLIYLSGCSTVNVHTDKPVNIYDGEMAIPEEAEIEILSDEGAVGEEITATETEEMEAAVYEAEMPEEVETIPELKKTTGKGRESLAKTDGDEEARENAIILAKEEAILRSVSKYVNPEILQSEKARLLNIFRPVQDEIIDRYKIVSEEKGEDGIYRVKISADIREDIIKDLLINNLYDDRVIVITAEKNLGNPLKRHMLEHDLINRIKEKGYTIVDYRTMSNDRVKRLVSRIRNGNSESVKNLGVYYLTDVVVVGYIESEYSEVTREIYSAHASGQIKIHQIGDRKELVSLTKHSVKGFGSNEEKAGIDSLRNISPEIAEEAVESLPVRYVNKVKLIIKEIGNYPSFKKAKELIAEIPYVYEVTEGIKDFDIEETTLYIKTTKGIDYIAEKISELKKFVIKEIGDDEISLESRKL